MLSEATLEQLGPRINVLFLGALNSQEPLTRTPLLQGNKLFFPGTLIPGSPPTTNSLFPATPGDGKLSLFFWHFRASLIPGNSRRQQIDNELICCSREPLFLGAPDKFLIPGNSRRRGRGVCCICCRGLLYLLSGFVVGPPYSRQNPATGNLQQIL